MASDASKSLLGLRHLLKLYADLEATRQKEELSRTFATFGTIYAIVKYWLGEQWAQRNLWPDTARCVFRFTFGHGTPSTELQALRMHCIAADLFNLQYVEGFQGLIQRMRSKEAEASLAELQVGRLLYIKCGR